MAPEELLGRVTAALEAVSAPYMLTGSLAAIFFGEPRLTVDIDLVVDLTEAQIVTLAAFFPPDEYYFDEVMAKEALAARGQFNILHIPSGLKVDLIVVRSRVFSQTEFSRRRRRRLGNGREVDVAQPEDLILAKMEFFREGGSDKHLRDIAGILRVCAGELDLAYIDGWAAELGLAKVWQALRP